MLILYIYLLMYLDLLYFLSRRRRRAELLMESLRKRSPRVVGGIITQDKVSAPLHVLCFFGFFFVTVGG